jgi:hypothetical protein
VTLGHDQTVVSPLEIRRDCEPDVVGTGRVAALAEEVVFPVHVIVGAGKSATRSLISRKSAGSFVGLDCASMHSQLFPLEASASRASGKEEKRPEGRSPAVLPLAKKVRLFLLASLRLQTKYERFRPPRAACAASAGRYRGQWGITRSRRQLKLTVGGAASPQRSLGRFHG